MNNSILSQLVCPACRVPYPVEQAAFLTCPNCCITIPVLKGFPLFGEQFLTDRQDPEGLAEKFFGKADAYLAFLERKREKPVYDLYAAFQPFNESTQCIFPLIPLLREHLKSGDLILDLWCRTGWTGELLSSLFPEQRVLSVWESSAGLLGYKGFDYWLGSGKRRENLDILFHSPNLPLPFASGTFAVVHGLDTLHRYHHVPLIAECLRVAKEDGLIVFPHNHLTNSRPDPYFDRGEDQLHGKEYEAYFRRLLKGSHRRAFVLSEATLFDAGPEYRLEDEADTQHYNALILLADAHYEGHTVIRKPKHCNEYQNAFVVINPLWHFDLTLGEAVISPAAMDSGAAELFFRHPLYHERLKKHNPVRLDETDCLILYRAMRFKTVAEIARILDLAVEDVFERLMSLEKKELVQVQNVSLAMAKLQSFYCRQEVPACGEDATLSALWQRTVSLYADRPFLIWPPDDSVFTYRDADTIVRMAASFLNAKGVQGGDFVMLDAVSHPEFVFLYWAVVLLGAVAVPVNPDLKSDAYAAIVSRTRPRLRLIEPALRREGGRDAIAFGVAEDSAGFAGSFADQVGEFEPWTNLPAALPQQPATVLFTSGSTGVPKGVVLSHGGLFGTSRIMDRAYGWRSEDRFLGGGSFHTMSGLRNPCIAVLHSGASVVVPGKENSLNPLAVMNVCLKHRVSILNVTPAFLAYWTVAAAKAKFYQSHNLRLILSTGSALQPGHRRTFEELFKVPVFDYYGLTETTGACILETAGTSDLPEKGIGRAWECIVKIAGDNGGALPAGQSGELAIYSENLMLGYLGDEELTGLRMQDGWFLTGDTARVNESGCVVLAGRKDRMMIDKNGENVYPEEVERVLCSINGVTDAYVTQVTDDLQMDHIGALVQFVDPREERMAQLRSELPGKLPALHIPSVIVAVPELPKTTSGKVSTETAKQLIRTALRKS